MTWHNAFVFRDGYADVYEVYYLSDGCARTMEPVMTLRAEDPRDLGVLLSQLVIDFGKGRYFESPEKLDQHYGMGGDDIE